MGGDGYETFGHFFGCGFVDIDWVWGWEECTEDGEDKGYLYDWDGGRCG
jgi:hypothetical protein